jgi:hypothetical protein
VVAGEDEVRQQRLCRSRRRGGFFGARLEHGELARDAIGSQGREQLELPAALSTLATRRLACASVAPSKPTRSPIATSSWGVCRECFPRPPQT